jgi:DNA ligase-1
MILKSCAIDREVKGLFELLAQTGSSLAKRDILAQNSGNGLFALYINYLLNPFLITGISAKKISKVTEKQPTQDFNTFTELMDYVLSNNTGSDEVIANIRLFLNNAEQDMRDFYSSIITKSARLGCDVKSVNKAFGKEFIPLWEVQQSYSLEKSPLKGNEWFSLSEKLNGVRGTFFEGKIISRQGKEFSGLEHITGDIVKLFPDAESWVIDGELVRVNTEGLSDNENFRIGTGLLSQDEGDKSSMQFVVFDLLPKSEFTQGESLKTYKDRLNLLRELEKKIIGQGITAVTTVKVLYSGDDDSMIDVLLDKMVDEDKEGLMLNRDSKYACKRHNGILKVKRFYTVDLVVTAVEEGSGRLAGKLGAFVVDYKGNALNVGSGMTDRQRDDFWDFRDNLIGRVIEVKYKEESSDKKTGQYSLQFPIFVSLREEGKEESYY